MPKRLFVLALALLAAFCAWSKEAEPVGVDPDADRHMMALASELRCLVCQNQTIADSQADLAGDLRERIRELIRQGQSDEQIKAYMVARYGDYVLYRPPVKNKTLLLWFGPGLVLVGGLAALYLALRRRNARLAAEAGASGAALSPDEERRAQRLLAQDAEEGLS